MKSVFHYIIVEDVPKQQEYLKKLLGTRIELTCAGVFDYHRQAYDFLIGDKNPAVDIIFLDIELPGESDGLHFLKSLQANLRELPSVIIISGFPNKYALPAFEYPVSGFVTKTIVEEKLHKAIDKAISEINKKPSKLPFVVPSLESEYFDFQVSATIVRIYLKDILFCESENVNVKIFKLDEKTVESRMTLTSLEAKLPASYFLRIKNCYIANMKYLSAYAAKTHHEIELINPNTGKVYKLEVGKTYREKLKDFLNRDSSLGLTTY